LVKFISEAVFRKRYGYPITTLFRKRRRLSFFSVKLKQRFILVKIHPDGRVEPIHVDKLRGFKLP